MSKFHINKHGVPSPCRAQKGNCPYGGEDTHFNTIEEAQEYADNENERKYSLLPSSGGDGGGGNKSRQAPFGGGDEFDDKDEAQKYADKMNEKMYGVNNEHGNYVVKIDDQAFNGSFPETYDHDGYTVTGVQKVALHEYAEADKNEALLELRDSLPDEILNDEDDYTLVPSHNAEDYFRYQVVSADKMEGKSEDYQKMVETVKEYNPNLIRSYMGEDAIDREFEDKISKFAAKKALSESKLIINGQKIIIGKNDGRNWAKEYIESLKDK